MRKLNIAYFGSPDFSAHLLTRLIKQKGEFYEITLVATQPDKPVGRKQTYTKSPVKVAAEEYKIEVWDDISNPLFLEKLRLIDIAVVYAYGFKKLIPMELLKAPKLTIGEGGTGFVNIHPSLLPRYRGSSPIAYPILLGEKLTGVSIFVMDEKMDHGPVIARETIEIALNDVRMDLETKLTDLGASMIKEMLVALAQEIVPAPKAQDHSLATRAPYMKKEDGYIPYLLLLKYLNNEAITAQELPHIIRTYMEKFPDTAAARSLKNRASSPILYDFYRGISPWPGLWTIVSVKEGEKRLKITEMTLENNKAVITKVQLEGKNEVDFPTFKKAYGLFG